MAEPQDLLVGERLAVEHEDRRVLDVEAIALREGELLAVLGPNGAGKSTLLRVLAMLDTPSSGRVRYGGLAGSAAERALRRSSAAVFQRPHFWRETVAYNVGLGLRLRRKPSAEVKARVRKFAQLLGIGEILDRDVGTLSGGQAQRVALARALVLEPEVLFLDEPTANLDLPARSALREDLERLARERAGAILLVTHDLTEALSLADRVAVLSEGRIVQVGTPTELYERPAVPYVANLTGAELTLRGTVRAVEDGLLVVDAGGGCLRATGAASAGDTVKIGYRPEDLVLSRADEPAGRLSTRNVLYATISELRPIGALVRVRLTGSHELAALVTRAAVEELGLEEGLRVCVRVKATALHAFSI